MIKPVVLLDCDGPLAGFTQAYLDEIALETGRACRVEQVDRWAIHECEFFAEAALHHGVTPAQLKSYVAGQVCKPGFCERIPVQEGAKEAVLRIAQVAEVYVVTSPWHTSPTWMHERTEWLWRHFAIPAKNVIHAQTKHLIHGDLFVDDKASHVTEWAEAHHPSGVGILFDMHHNQREANGPLAIRGGWPQVHELLDSFRIWRR